MFSNAAKYFWYTEIYGILPDDSDNLDGFGTDKQVVMYHISCLTSELWLYLFIR